MWESRWPSWAVRPNEPSGFLGRKAILNHASALVSACPLYVNRHPRTLSNTTYLPATGRTTMLRSWGPRPPARSNLCTLLISVSTTVRSKVTKAVSEKQLLRNNWSKGLSNSLCRAQLHLPALHLAWTLPRRCEKRETIMPKLQWHLWQLLRQRWCQAVWALALPLDYISDVAEMGWVGGWVGVGGRGSVTWRGGDLSDAERGDLSDVERGDLSDVERGTRCMGNSLSSISPLTRPAPWRGHPSAAAKDCRSK